MECGDILPVGSVQMEMYDTVAIPTHKNDERRSRKPHKMESYAVVAQSRECVG